MSFPSYAPGTLIRCYTEDRSAHNTAILLPDGAVLELKNIDGSPKVKHESWAAWYSKRNAGGYLEADTRKAGGVVMTTDTRGFNTTPIVGSLNGHHVWPAWCYRVMVEAAPKLLKDAAVKDAFNALVATVEKHKSGDPVWTYYSSARDFYDPKHLTLREADASKGLYFRFGKEWQASWRPQETTWTAEMFAAAKAEVGEAYKALYLLISEALLPFLTKKHELLQSQAKLRDEISLARWQEKCLRETRRKMAYLQRSYDYRMNQLKKDAEQRAEWKADKDASVAKLEARIKELSS